MAKSASSILKAITEFCRERSDILMIAGVALIILIILFAIIKSIVKKDDDEDDFDFDEEEFSKDKLQDKGEEKEKSAQSFEPTTEDVGKAEDRIISKQSIENLLGEISNIPVKNLEEVEIRIQGAEVKLKYSKNDNMGSDGQELQTEAPSGSNSAGEDDQTIEGDCNQTAELCDNEEDAEEKAEDKKEEKHRTSKKFGPNNIDTSRSGHVFTEDELEEQIRD